MTLTEASKRIHWSLGGRGMLGSVKIQVPEGWSASDCGLHELASSHYIGVSRSWSTLTVKCEVMVIGPNELKHNWLTHQSLSISIIPGVQQFVITWLSHQEIFMASKYISCSGLCVGNRWPHHSSESCSTILSSSHPPEMSVWIRINEHISLFPQSAFFVFSGPKQYHYITLTPALYLL